MSAQRDTSFFDLPTEIRLMVFDYFLPLTVTVTYAPHFIFNGDKMHRAHAQSMMSGHKRDDFASHWPMMTSLTYLRAPDSENEGYYSSTITNSEQDGKEIIKTVFSLLQTCKPVNSDLATMLFSNITIKPSSAMEAVALSLLLPLRSAQQIRSIALARLFPGYISKCMLSDMMQAVVWLKLLSRALPNLDRVTFGMSLLKKRDQPNVPEWLMNDRMMFSMVPVGSLRLGASSYKRDLTFEKKTWQGQFPYSAAFTVRFEKEFSGDEGYVRCDFGEEWMQELGRFADTAAVREDHLR